MQYDKHWLSVMDAFANAALDESGWHQALKELADICGSRSGELIGIGPDGSLPFNIVTELDPDCLDEFADLDGGNPDLNPRVRAGVQAPVLEVLAEHEFVTPEERRSNPFYDLYQRYDIPHICLASLVKEPGLLVGLAVMRSGKQGEIDGQQRELFTAIAPHVRTAVRIQLVLEKRGASIISGALEGMDMCAFVCDRHGNVRTMTPAAETLLSRGNLLTCRHDQLRTVPAVDSTSFDNAIHRIQQASAGSPGPQLCSVVVKDSQQHPCVIDVIGLPRRDYAFGFAPRMLVVVRDKHAAAGNLAPLLQAAYQLTKAETDVALRIASGVTLVQVAQDRNTSLETVRAQLRTIFLKMGVHRQSELVAHINSLR